MASPELTEIIELYEDNEYNPEARIQACQKMWELRDPEAILALAIIYKEDPEELVRTEAREVLRNFKAMQRDMERAASGDKDEKKKKRRNWVPLQTLLILSLTVLLVANGLLFAIELTATDPTPTATPLPTLTAEQLRTQFLNRVSNYVSGVVGYSEGLREQLLSIQSGGAILNACQYRRQVARPQPFELNALEQQLRDAYYMRDIVAYVEDEAGDIEFMMDGLFGEDRSGGVIGFYEVDLCSNPNPGDDVLSQIPANISRLDAVLDGARAAQFNLENFGTTIVPTFTPPPTTNTPEPPSVQ